MSELDKGSSDNLIVMGRIGAAHGIKGGLKVKSFTQNPLSLGDYGALQDKDGRQYNIKNIRVQKNSTIVHFKEITNRNLAETLNGVELFIERSILPADLETEEFYIFDLIGLDVMSDKGELVGTILNIENFGAGDLLEISPVMENGGFSDKTYYLAFTKQNVPQIDLKKHFITIIPPFEVVVQKGEIKEAEKGAEGREENNEQS